MHYGAVFFQGASVFFLARVSQRVWLLVRFILLTSVFLLLTGALPEVNAQTTGVDSTTASPKGLTPGPYIGIAAGISQLNPDTGMDDRLQVTDDSADAFQATLGVDLANWVSMELHAADLGSAGLSDGSAIGYREYGLSALFYAGGARDRYNRHGWTVFGRTGMGYRDISLTNSESASISDKPHWILGAGAEYALRNGLGLRAEGIAYDEDVSQIQIGLVYRTGHAFALFDQSETSASKLQTDDDNDGIVLANDNCPDTPSNVAVDENGCAVFNGVVDGLTFMPGSAKLTSGARVVLDGVAESLIALPDARAQVTAHTDGAGDAGVNMQLSQWRAFEVARYLVDNGVSASRLEARAFGELRPIDVNTTAEGRRNNRRVEITVISE